MLFTGIIVFFCVYSNKSVGNGKCYKSELMYHKQAVHQWTLE